MSTKYSVGDEVWVYEHSTYPIEAEISNVVMCDLFTKDGQPELLGYEVKHESSMTFSRWIGEHNIYPRPAGKDALLKELRDDIEFLEQQEREIEASYT
jgi:hypothetical protein